MNTIVKLKDETLAQLSALKDRCISENRNPTAEEHRIADQLLKQYDILEWTGDQPAGPIHKPNISGGMGDDPVYSVGSVTNRPTYRSLFGAPKATDDFKTFGEFLATVASNRSDKRLMVSEGRNMVEAVPSQGGFLVPDEHRAEIIDMILEQSIIMPRATVYPMSHKSLKVDAIDDSDHSSSRGGLAAVWTAEEGTMSPNDIDIRQLEFTAHKLTLFLKCSNEWLADAPGSDAMIKRAVAAEMAWQLDHVFINTGTGAGQPLSILKCGGCKSVAKETGQDADTYLWENACAQHEAFHPAGEANGLWLMSPSLKSQVFTMNQAIGTGGSHFWPALSQASGRVDLLGLPLIFTEHCKAAGDQGDCLLINPKKYAIALRADLRIESSKHTYFTTDHTAYRAILRVDAMPINNEVLTLSDGTTEVADFVTLDARA
jgi:HK97 family phage major capsid protein